MKSSSVSRGRFPEADSSLIRNKSFGALDEIVAPTPLRKTAFDLRLSKQSRAVPSRQSSLRNLTRSCPDDPHFGAAEQEIVTILSRENSCDDIAGSFMTEVPPIVAVSPPSVIPLRASNPMIRNDRFNSSIDAYTPNAVLPTKKIMYRTVSERSLSSRDKRSMSWPASVVPEVGFLPPVEAGAGAAY
eukprot:TRINITY_DN5833_c0_g1_i1.p1 TRINITY_DN5833_c0_g1~~TRINITY_DN5833_c0_g1_i1.p1  ORF type:complete len:187 (+),score=26.24 TRINITY_DN5833_c0_g1_i1:181-741(+)